MSQENVAIVRALFAALDRGELSLAAECLDPNIEWLIAREHPDSRTLIGHEALAAYQRDWQATLPDMRVEYDRVLDVEDKVVAIGTVRGTGVGSGADVRVPLAILVTLRNGLITRAEEYLNPNDALEVVGLEK